MNLINNANSKMFEKKNYFDKKSNLNVFHKNKSDNSLPNFFCNQFNKSLITGSNYMSEASTKNTLLGLNEKNRNFKKNIEINVIEELSPENIDKIINNKIKVFEALDNLSKFDNDNDEQINNNYIKKDSKVGKDTNKLYDLKTQNINISKNKRVKCLSVPKLDFTHIFNQYNCKPFYIQEVKYIYSTNKKNSDNKGINESNDKINSKNNFNQEK